MSAEIRITDACIVEHSGKIFLSLHARGEPLKIIANRLAPILKNEKIDYSLTIDKAEFTKQPLISEVPQNQAKAA